MPFLTMRHDFRARRSGPRRRTEIYAAALEQFAWADAHGFDSLVLSEHHGIDDGWMPGAAHDGRGGARRARSAPVLMVSAAILPLHDPIRVAEQIAVLDNAFPGRLVDRVRRGLPRRGVRDGGRRARGARPDPRGAHRSACSRRGPVSRSSGGAARCASRRSRRRDPHRMLFVGGGVPAAAAPCRAAAPADDADEHRPGGARGVPRRGEASRLRRAGS